MTDETNNPEKPLFSAAEDIDVQQIMVEIRRQIEEKKSSGLLRQVEISEIEEMELQPLPDFLEIPNVYENHLYPEHASADYTPFHIEPELEGGAAKKALGLLRRLMMPLLRFMLRPFRTDLQNLIVELSNSNSRDIHHLKTLIPVVQQSKEYVKLLHNTINNMIVEASKLKIEEELSKTKIKVLEDKIAFLEARQRAIEDKLYNGS
ncbi:MAG: hypothetical protein RB296_04425 [Acidobacteriota bacterium]|jgi:hypothetical protein|nr:hypothetical protein [Acidobacteriota bacterium]